MNYYDAFDKMLGGKAKIALEDLYTSRLDKMMDRVSEGEFSDAYEAYIYDQTPIGNGEMLIEALESGDYLEDFCQSILVGRVIK
tara:strand:+ start:135 stop:386 length:252 start_codon:yes stop_codon:yes gene_type:complete